MISVLYFFCPVSLSSHDEDCSLPSTYTVRPFFKYSPTISAVRWKATRLCHSVLSCQLPSLSLKRSLVASVKRAIAMPLGVYFTSGSLPRLPRRMTLLTLFAMRNSSCLRCGMCCELQRISESGWRLSNENLVQHYENNHSGNRDVQPNGKGIAGDGLVADEIAL